MNYDKIYVLNPDYIIKNDIDRVLLYSKNKVSNYSSVNKLCFLHPIQAEIFSFFTYKRTLDENILLLSDYLELSFDEVYKMISPFLENDQELTLSYQKKRIRIPRNVLISKDKCIDKDLFREIPNEQMRCKNINLSARRISTFPILITLMISNKCVTKCKYCYADTQTTVKENLSTERMLSIIEEASMIGVKNINLAGGEIFLRKDWHIILRKLIEKNYSPDIISTKYPINESIISKLKYTNYTDRIQISLDSINENVLINILGVKEGYLDKIKAGIILLEKNNIPFQITTVLTKYNTDILLMEELFDFVSSFEMLKTWEIRPIMASLYKGNFENIRAKKEDIELVFDAIGKKRDVSHFNIRMIRDTIDKHYYEESKGSSFFKGAKCSALNTHMFVLPDGQVTICEQLYWNPHFIIGNLSSQNIKEVWTSERAHFFAYIDRSKIQENSNCKNCKILSYCFSNNRCWVDVIKSYGKQCWDYPDPRCSYAPLMINDLKY